MTSNSDRLLAHEPVYHWEEFVENLEGYCSGGYHPTHLGDIFHGRYRVMHKLGYGSYSTVWLARDLEEHRNVALKILVAGQSQASTEAQILRALNAGDKNHPGYSFICRLLDEFWFDGPNGRHRCLVLRATGCSVSDSQDDSNEFPIHVARSMSAQALLGLSYIHSCGFVHGDLHKGNLLFERPELESWTEAEVVQNLGEAEKEPVKRRDGQSHGPEAPDYCVPLGMIGMRSDRLPENIRITISDFGQSFLATEDHDALQTPRKVAPPEHFFKGHLGPPADVWTLGLSIYEILSTRSLFETYFPDPDTIISEMVDTLGRPPQCWWDSWANKQNFYAEDGSRIGEPPMPLSTRLKEREGEIGDEEQKSLEQLYRGKRSEKGEVLSRGMLEYEPSKRMTTDEALMSDWMIRWARPDFEKCVAGQQEDVPQSSGEKSDQPVASSFTVEDINDDNEVAGRSRHLPDSEESLNLFNAKDASLSDAARNNSPTASIAGGAKDFGDSSGNDNVNDAVLSDTAHNGRAVVSAAGGIKGYNSRGGDYSTRGL